MVEALLLMLAAGRRELAYESRELRHSLFTAALLDGLSGKGSGLKLTDGAVYFKQLDAYVTDRVKTLSSGRQHPVTAVPRAFRDFPISKP